MHLVFYGQNILDLNSFSTPVSWAIVVGGLYGSLRLVIDLARNWRELFRLGPKDGLTGSQGSDVGSSEERVERPSQ